jgi:hypothetical protein
MAKMNNLLTCKECEAIALELREAYADAWISSDQESRDAWIATYKLIGGKEEDAVRAEELVSSAQICSKRAIIGWQANTRFVGSHFFPAT